MIYDYFGRRHRRRIDQILQTISDAGPFAFGGLQIVKRSYGRLSRGTVYIWLNEMEDDGLIASRKAERDPPTKYKRRVYALTEAGAVRLKNSVEFLG